jgi:hypothetical protein
MHLLTWVDRHPLLGHLVDPLRPAMAGYERRLAEDLAKIGTPPINEISGPWDTSSREDAAALSFAAVKAAIDLDWSDKRTPHAEVIALVAAGHNPEERGRTVGDLVDVFRDVSIQNIYDFLDEQIDGRNVVLGLLLKYKTRCEWYRRDRLRGLAVKGVEGRTGERALAFDLYEYLHGQGVDFAIESVTASGEPDLVAENAGGQPLVADAKYVTDDGQLAQTLAAGFRQVVQYCRDKNEPIGYLVVFLNCGKTPEIVGDRDDGFPCFRLGGISVYYVVIDIRERTNTASKLPKPRVVEIDRVRLVTMVEEDERP